MDYGKALRISRAIAGMQQKELAVKAKLDPSYVSLIERGDRTPSVKAVRALSSALNIPTHLFTLLATESEDVELSDPRELEDIGRSLAGLLIHWTVEKGNGPT